MSCSGNEARENTKQKIDKECDPNLIQTYESMVKSKKVIYDRFQIKALFELDRLRKDLLEKNRSESNSIVDDPQKKISQISHSSSKITWSTFFSSFEASTNSISSYSSSLSLDISSKRKSIKGVYLHGGVGCGKTFCMDLFYNSLHTQQKQKVHFHKFMIDQVHREMHKIKASKDGKLLDADEVLEKVIIKILQHGVVLCFDEFQVTDVADALILRRLFTGLISKGANVVFTSNRPPEDLYIGGIQRDLFLPFIDFIYQNTSVISMRDSETDYRLLIAAQYKTRGIYFIGPSEKQLFDAAVANLIPIMADPRTIFTLDGRKVRIPLAFEKVAKFAFKDLCKTAMGAADFLAIGENFHTVIIESIPILSVVDEINVVRRFIVFVDSMYECNVKLIIHAEAEPSKLFIVEDLNSSDEAFAVDRTRSRLEEMKSESYLKKRWVGD